MISSLGSGTSSNGGPSGSRRAPRRKRERIPSRRAVEPREHSVPGTAFLCAASPVRASAILSLATLMVAALVPTAQAKVFHSQEEALELAFPDAERIDSRTYILSSSQKQAIEKQARSELESEIVTLFSGWRGDELLGRAYIDIHTVRTLPEAFMVVLSPAGQVESLRVLAFYEPTEYMPTRRWYDQFDGADQQRLEKGMRLGRDVHGVVGATLSARAVTESVRRVLAFHNVLVAKVDAAPPTRERPTLDEPAVDPAKGQ